MTAPDTSAEVERFSAEYVRFLAGLDGPTCQPTEDDERLSHEIGEVPVLAAEIVELRARVLRLRREHNEALAEIDRLRALLPSPAAVRAARVLAAETIEDLWTRAGYECAQAEAYGLSLDEAARCAGCARVLRDLARTHLYDGADVDAATLAMIALRVDGLATLGELEAVARELREAT